MTSFSDHFSLDEGPDVAAKIAVIGVGGGGGNAVNNMIAKDIQGVSFVVVNTDNQALVTSAAAKRIQAGQSLTRGLGAGARPQVGAEAVEESRMEIEQALQGLDMVFITAGMGGGTGTGGAPVVAQIARRLGILTVAVVTRPFKFEGSKRMRSAMEGIALLKEHVDTIVTIPNERLLEIEEGKLSILDAFVRADDVLYEATRGISDLITRHGLINLDFADVKTTMKDGGMALMGSAVASGENRAERAAIEAITSPLFDGLSISGARNVLVNITAGRSMGVGEAAAATEAIGREAGDEVEVIFGTVIDDSMGEELRVTVIATGFETEHTARVHAATPAPPSVRTEGDGYGHTAQTPTAHGHAPQAPHAPAPHAPAPPVYPAPLARTAPAYDVDLGFDLPDVPPAPRVAPLLTPIVTPPVSRPGYRTAAPGGPPERPEGERQIKDLDRPAFERRPPIEGATPPADALPGPRARRFSLNDPPPPPDRTERPPRDGHTTPTFLRRQMD